MASLPDRQLRKIDSDLEAEIRASLPDRQLRNYHQVSYV